MKTDDERIAEWLGWENPGEREEASRMGATSLEGAWDLAFNWKKPSGAYVPLPQFNMYISEWHKPDGLFAKIKERGLWAMFLAQLLKDIDAFVATEDDGSEWIETRHVFSLLAVVSPSQLTATLLKVIDAKDISPKDEKMSADLFDKIYKRLVVAFWGSEGDAKTRKDFRLMIDKEFGEETMKQFAVELKKRNVA